MALKRITPNVKDASLSTKIRTEYKDLDLNFKSKSGSVFQDGIRRGDVYKKESVKAIDQSISNILSTNYFERPFQPFFGANLVQLLFELNTMISENDMRSIISGAVEKDEPRVRVLDIEVYDGASEEMVPRGSADVFLFAGTNHDDHSLLVNVYCQIKSTGQEIVVPINMNRLR